MTRIGRPKGLIRYASLNGIERGERLRITPRLVGYTTLLLALAGVLAFLVFTRSDVETTLLRAPGALFQQMPDGRFSNLYTLKIINKTSRDTPVQLKLDSPPGTIEVMGRADLIVPKEKLTETSVLVELDRAVLRNGTTPVVIGVYSGGRRLQTIKTGFIGPRNL